MKNKLKIAVIGGTGKSGRYLVQELIGKGYSLKILVRNPENFKVESNLVEVVYGDVRNYEIVKSLIKECDLVLSTLGGTPLSEPTVFSQATRNILTAMTEIDINRYIVVTGLNVDTPLDIKSQKTKFATDWMYDNYPKSTKDRQDEYDLLVESKLDWTLVRLPMIELTDERKETKASLEDCVGDNISATDLAHFLIKQISDTSFIKEAPFIMNI